MKSKQDLISLGQTNYLKYAKTANLEDLIDLYAEIREIQTQTEFYFSDSDVRFDVSWVFTYEEIQQAIKNKKLFHPIHDEEIIDFTKKIQVIYCANDFAREIAKISRGVF